MSKWTVALFAICVLHNLIWLKFLRLGFDRWYALVEASFTAPTRPSPDSRSAVMRWLFPAPAAEFAGGGDHRCRGRVFIDGNSVLC